MAEFYSSSHRKIQDTFETRDLADTVHDKVMRSVLAPMDRKFVSTSDFFFLSTIDHNGFPTVSYKGGFPGFVRVLGDSTICFPVYDGNGMFYSMGNIVDIGKVGLLFIDFEHPRRLRLHGTASLSTDDPILSEYTGALMVVTVAIETIFTNCPRYIHTYQRVKNSKFVPKSGVETPVPEWKRVDYLQIKLPTRDKEAAQKSGDTITEAEYRKHFWEGLE